MLSFSTCWNSARHTEGAPMIQEILDLGFENVELSHGIRISLAGGIQADVRPGQGAHLQPA